MKPGNLADIVVFIHLLYVLFTVAGELFILLGGAFKWRWIRNMPFRIIHMIASFFVAFEVFIGMTCPLTSLEYTLRTEAGQYVNTQISFIGQLIRKIIFYDFPPVFFILLYTGFALLVILSFIFIPPRRKNRRKKQGTIF